MISPSNIKICSYNFSSMALQMCLNIITVDMPKLMGKRPQSLNSEQVGGEVDVQREEHANRLSSVK